MLPLLRASKLLGDDLNEIIEARYDFWLKLLLHLSMRSFVGVVVHFVCKSVPWQKQTFPPKTWLMMLRRSLGQIKITTTTKKANGRHISCSLKHIGYNLSLLTDFRCSRRWISTHVKRTSIVTQHTLLDCLNITEVQRGGPTRKSAPSWNNSSIRLQPHRSDWSAAAALLCCRLHHHTWALPSTGEDATLWSITMLTNPMNRYVSWPVEKNQAF